MPDLEILVCSMFQDAPNYWRIAQPGETPTSFDVSLVTRKGDELDETEETTHSSLTAAAEQAVALLVKYPDAAVTYLP